MAPTKRTLATRETVHALYRNGVLVIVATGKVPTPRHAVAIRRARLPADPLRFSLVQCRAPGICADTITPYVVSRAFGIGGAPDGIVVAHAGKPEEVAVERIGSRSHTTVSVLGEEIPLAYFLPPSSQAREAEGCSAVGYSTGLDFAAALRQAIAALPPLMPPYANQVGRITVLETGVELGGVTAFHHLFVRVARQVATTSPNRG